MKTKWTTNLITKVITFGMVVIIAAYYLFCIYQMDHVKGAHIINGVDVSVSSNMPNNLKPIDETIPDSLSYKKYLHLKDSVRIIRGLKNGDSYNGSGVSIGGIGTTSSIYCDTCNLKWYYQKAFNDDAPKQYYIKLLYWKIKNASSNIAERVGSDSVQFYVNHGQSYIRKVHVDKTVKLKGGLELHESLVDVPVKFRYSRTGNCLLIPVSKSVNNFTYYFLTGFSFLFLVFYWYLILLVIRLVIDLSKGLAFTDANIWRLKFVGICNLIIPAVMIGLNFVLKLIFYKYFTEDVLLNKAAWTDSWETIAAGIVFLLLYRAFRQGKLLKDEQDLTV